MCATDGLGHRTLLLPAPKSPMGETDSIFPVTFRARSSRGSARLNARAYEGRHRTPRSRTELRNLCDEELTWVEHLASRILRENTNLNTEIIEHEGLLVVGKTTLCVLLCACRGYGS